MTTDDALFHFRVRTLALAQEMGSVRAACRAMGIHPSTFYRWRKEADRFGLEILRPRERRQTRAANATTPQVEKHVLEYSVLNPGCGPARISAELRREKWGGVQLSPNGVWRVLKRHGLQTRARRLALVAGYAAPPAPERPEPQPERHLEADLPGDLVQMDCFYVGKLSGTKGVTWQYTAIDVASAHVWAELYVTPKNPDPRWCSKLAEHVAEDLAARGWRMAKVMTDNGSEFRSKVFEDALAALQAKHVFIRAGRPQTNGCVERVQQTILEECWKPAFARFLIPKYTGLRLDLRRYLRYYNTDRANTGRFTKGRTPEEVIGKAKMWPGRRSPVSR